MSVESLKERMREFTEGRAEHVSISSADVAAAAAEDSKGAGQEPDGTVSVEIPEAAKRDGIMNSGGKAGSAHAGLVSGSASFLDSVEVTAEDRAAFLDAIVTGGRYERSFSLFNGRLTGTFRCRSTAESDGIITWVGHLLNENKLTSNVEYMSAIRNATLAAQVKSLRGLVNEDFPELPAPLAPTRASDGKSVLAPGWIGVADSWYERPEAITTAVYAALQRFEQVYWAMVTNAANQNFWSPATSI